MDILNWRPIVKVVAIVERVRVAVDFGFRSAMIVAALAWGPVELLKVMYWEMDEDPGYQSSSADDAEHHSKMIGASVILFIFLSLGVICCLIEGILVRKLQAACELSCEPTNAVRKARTWINVKFAITCISLREVWRVLQSDSLVFKMVAVGRLSWNVVGIFVVILYLRELDALIVFLSELQDIAGIKEMKGNLNEREKDPYRSRSTELQVTQFESGRRWRSGQV